MNVVSMANPVSHETILPKALTKSTQYGTELAQSPESATFADCLQNLELPKTDISTQSEVATDEIERTAPSIELENNPLLEIYSKAVESVTEKVCGLNESQPQAQITQLTQLVKTVWEEWQKLQGAFTQGTLTAQGALTEQNHGEIEVDLANDKTKVSKTQTARVAQYEDFVKELVEIFIILINYGKGEEIDEKQKIDAIIEILAKREKRVGAIENNAGTEEGRAVYQLHEKTGELITQLLKKVYPKTEDWSIIAQPTKGGAKPLIEANESVGGNAVYRTAKPNSQELKQSASQSYVPNVHGLTQSGEITQTAIPAKTIQSASGIAKSELYTVQNEVSIETPKTLHGVTLSQTLSSAQNGQFGQALNTKGSQSVFGVPGSEKFRYVSSNIAQDITEYEVTKLFGENNTGRQTETIMYQRPIIFGEVIVSETAEISNAKLESPESNELIEFDETSMDTKAVAHTVNAETKKEAAKTKALETKETLPTEFSIHAQAPVFGQQVALQVSSSIVENLEKIISQANGTTETQTMLDPSAEILKGSGEIVTKSTNVTAAAKAFGSEASEFKITLNPEHLGKVTVKLVTSEKIPGEVKVAVQIIAASEKVRDLLIARAGSVRVMIELSGVTVERYDVVTDGENQIITSANETARDILDDESGKNGQNNAENQKESESEQEQNEISFAEFIQTMI
ncbi:MAG: flagellar hook-length control protein FliK [Oscillospiraceae bacterium]|nr:flagellar hook-length control protein FliK [Oscillospiraceae bacterium]